MTLTKTVPQNMRLPSTRICPSARRVLELPAMVDYPHALYRLILTPPADGSTQMAIDEAIWWAVAAGDALPTLRFYAWEPPCLSLGRNQPVSDADRVALAMAGYTLVRRPTGGRAILHVDELTYSLVVPLTDPRVQGDVLASCRRLSQGLLAGLELLGVPTAEAHQRSRNGRSPAPICFETPADFEVTVNGQKLIGSAQMRGRKTVLQHGTLPLRGDISRICTYLTTPTDPSRVRSRATTLERVLGRDVSWEQVAAAMAAGFEQALNLQLQPGGLSPAEERMAKELSVSKYGAETWNARH